MFFFLSRYCPDISDMFFFLSRHCAGILICFPSFPDIVYEFLYVFLPFQIFSKCFCFFFPFQTLCRHLLYVFLPFHIFSTNSLYVFLHFQILSWHFSFFFLPSLLLVFTGCNTESGLPCSCAVIYSCRPLSGRHIRFQHASSLISKFSSF